MRVRGLSIANAVAPSHLWYDGRICSECGIECGTGQLSWNRLCPSCKLIYNRDCLAQIMDGMDWSQPGKQIHCDCGESSIGIMQWRVGRSARELWLCEECSTIMHADLATANTIFRWLLSNPVPLSELTP